MKPFEECIQEIHHLLDQLIATATHMRDVSLHKISEEELVPLQRKQENILAQIKTADDELQKHYSTDIHSSIHEDFKRKLEQFQTLNQAFIQNLHASHGLIQFELKHLRENDELPRHLSSLNFNFSESMDSEKLDPKDP